MMRQAAGRYDVFYGLTSGVIPVFSDDYGVGIEAQNLLSERLCSCFAAMASVPGHYSHQDSPARAPAGRTIMRSILGPPRRKALIVAFSLYR